MQEHAQDPLGGGPPKLPPLLEVEDLRTYFQTPQGLARAVDGVSLTLRAGETLGLVGESGCGKSATALSIMGLVPEPPGRRAGGRILLGGTDLLSLRESDMRLRRGSDMAMIFQDSMTALNPVYRVGDQLAESLRRKTRMGRAETAELVEQSLRRVGIPDPHRRAQAYPHQLSGGMRQRVMIAMALAADPLLLIADEPTTALDVTIQAQILDLLDELQAQSGLGLLLITHDLGVVAEQADQVAVMYAGKIVEYAEARELFDTPRHPYTTALLACVADMERPRARLVTIPGRVPAATEYPSGCRFRTRCGYADELCASAEPALASLDAASNHQVACHHWKEVCP